VKSAAVTVGTTAVLVLAADDLHRVIYVHHESNQAIYLGGVNVTTSNGLHVEKDDTIAIELPQRQTLYAIADLAGQEIRVLYPDQD